MVRISQHAIERYQQRVEPVSDEMAIRALTTPAIEAAARLGVQCKVRRSDGWDVAIKNGVVVSVVPRLNTRNRPSAAKMKSMVRNRKRNRNG